MVAMMQILGEIGHCYNDNYCSLIIKTIILWSGPLLKSVQVHDFAQEVFFGVLGKWVIILAYHLLYILGQ